MTILTFLPSSRNGGQFVRFTSGGETFVFRVKDRIQPPVNTVLPSFTLNTGTAGKIGATYNISAGTWTGSPSSVTHQLYRGDLPIPGTEGATSYTLVAADDRQVILVKETAIKEGWDPITVSSSSVNVTYIAPTATGTISNVSYGQGTGIHSIDSTTKFTGSGLTYTLVGPADVTIDEGIINIPSTNTISATSTVVTATNSGGFATQSFNITITGVSPPVDKPEKIDGSDVEVTFRVDPQAGTLGIPADAVTWHFKLLSPPAGMTALWWHGDAATASMEPGAGFHPTIAHPTLADTWVARAADSTNLDTVAIKPWLWVNSANVNYNKLGQTVEETLIYTKTALPPTSSAVFSEFSDVLSQTCAIYTTPPPDPVGLKSRRFPLMYEGEWNAGSLPGDTMQNWHGLASSLSDPNYVYGIQDTGSVWKSIDHGKTWRKPFCTGLGSFQGLGIVVDPQNKDHVLVNMGGSYSSTAAHEGIWRSTDGCATFGARILASSNAARRETHNSMAFAPGSGLTSGRTSKALVIACGIEEGVDANFPIARTTDGGNAWTTIGSTWSQAANGLITFMVGDASEDNRFYVSATKGFVRITNAFSGTFTMTKLSGTGGLPTGAVEGPAYVSSDGATIIVGVGGKGIYRTTTGTDAVPSWSQLGSHNNFDRLWVNPYAPARMLTTTSQGSTSQTPFYSSNGTTTATFTAATQANVEKRFSTAGNTNMIGNYVGVAWHTTTGHIFMSGRATSLPNSSSNFRTEDGGVNWKLANNGFCGANFGIRGASPNLFHPTDKNYMMTCMLDLGSRYSNTGGKWFRDRGYTTSTFSPALSKNTSFGAAIHPDETSNICFALVQESGPRLIRSTNGGVSWTEITGVANGSYTIFAEPTDDSIWYCGRKKSTDDGATFPTTMTELPSDSVVCDRTHYGASNPAIWGHNLGGACDSFYRSTNKGVNWTLMLTMGYNNKIPGYKWGPLACHPTNRDIIFTAHPSQGWKIRKWDVSTGSSATTRTFTDLNIFGGSNTPPSDYVADFIVKAFAIDPRTPSVMYAMTQNGGDARVYRTTDGGATAWTVMDGDVVPKGCNLNALIVHPITGDCFVGGSNGTFIIPPPYAQTDPTTFFNDFNYDNYLGPVPT